MNKTVLKTIFYRNLSCINLAMKSSLFLLITIFGMVFKTLHADLYRLNSYPPKTITKLNMTMLLGTWHNYASNWYNSLHHEYVHEEKECHSFRILPCEVSNTSMNTFVYMKEKYR